MLCFVNLLIVTLVFGLAFAHVLEWPGKLQLNGLAWLTVQQRLYNAFGPFASVAEPLAIVLTWVLVIVSRGCRLTFVLTFVAAISVTAGLIVWYLTVAPVNAVVNGWTSGTLPGNWSAYRDQWELGHAVHAILFGLAFCTLLAAILAKDPAIRRNDPNAPRVRD